MRRVDSRARILDAALRLFDEQGYAATSMEDIRIAAGFRTKSGLYAHFRSKEALSRALFRQVMAEEAAYLAPYVKNPHGASLGDLLDVAGHLVQWGLTHQAAYRFCFLRWHRDDPPLSPEDRAMVDRIPEWAATVLRRLQETDPNLRKEDPMLLVSAGQGIINQIVVTAPSGLPDDAVRRLASVARELCAAVLQI